MIWARKECFSLLLGLTLLQRGLLRLSWCGAGVGVRVGKLKYSAWAPELRSWLLGAAFNGCIVSLTRGCLGNNDKNGSWDFGGLSEIKKHRSLVQNTYDLWHMPHEGLQIMGTRETFLVLLRLIRTNYSFKEVQSGDGGVSGEVCRNGQGQREDMLTKDGIYKESYKNNHSLKDGSHSSLFRSLLDLPRE